MVRNDFMALRLKITGMKGLNMIRNAFNRSSPVFALTCTFRVKVIQTNNDLILFDKCYDKKAMDFFQNNQEKITSMIKNISINTGYRIDDGKSHHVALAISTTGRIMQLYVDGDIVDDDSLSSLLNSLDHHLNSS